MKTNGKKGSLCLVNVLLNRIDAGNSDPPRVLHSEGRITQPAETLLVVDDDAAVRRLEAQVLRREGYQVLQARSAEEALRLAGGTRAIHLLITCFSLPEVDGLELSHRFRKVHPRAPVLMVSGSLPLLRDGTRDLESAALLVKPFASEELLRRVRTLLDTAVSPSRRKPSCCD